MYLVSAHRVCSRVWRLAVSPGLLAVPGLYTGSRVLRTPPPPPATIPTSLYPPAVIPSCITSPAPCSKEPWKPHMYIATPTRFHLCPSLVFPPPRGALCPFPCSFKPSIRLPGPFVSLSSGAGASSRRPLCFVLHLGSCVYYAYVFASCVAFRVSKLYLCICTCIVPRKKEKTATVTVRSSLIVLFNKRKKRFEKEKF
jgi:hypothetical protein